MKIENYLTWHVYRVMTILLQKMVVFEHSEKRRRHWPKRRNRNVPPVRNANHPEEITVVYNNRWRRLKPIEKPFKGVFHFGHNGFEESHEVVSSTLFGGNNVGDWGESNVVLGFWFGLDEAEPFFGDHEGYEDVGVLGYKQLAEVHHGVHVASSWVRHSHHVAGDGWWSRNWIWILHGEIRVVFQCFWRVKLRRWSHHKTKGLRSE